jgi:hypothetical protein
MDILQDLHFELPLPAQHADFIAVNQDMNMATIGPSQDRADAGARLLFLHLHGK